MKAITTERILNGILLVMLLIFVFQNLESARVTFLVFSFELPLVILIALVFGAGYLTARVWGMAKDEKP